VEETPFGNWIKAKTCLRLAWERGFEETVLAQFKVLTPFTVRHSHRNEVVADLMSYALK